MKLLIPYIDKLQDLDARLSRLAAFLGVDYHALPLVRDVVRHIDYFESVIPDQPSCLVVNPVVLQEWLGAERLSVDLVSFLLLRFSSVFVHGLRQQHFDDHLVSMLSEGQLQGVRGLDEDSAVYEVAKDSYDVCGPFAGISFGPVNPANDHVLLANAKTEALRERISIGGHPFMATMKAKQTEILFVASKNVADVNEEIGDAPLAEYFSQFVPHAMALRYVAGDECWRPRNACASIIVDDPLLRENYGFLNFESLLKLTNHYNFHATIAFIPHNFKRNSFRITRMFQESSERLSICFHGNDHTAAEFASSNLTWLNTLLKIAGERMDAHQQMTGLPCDRVMVFPQGNFSVEAMEALKCNNFHAAVNTVPHPAKQPTCLTIAELAQPAVLRYGGFPLFLRKSSQQSQLHDIAFNVFFGRPVFIVEHHDIFKHPDALVEVVARINSVVSNIDWSNLATAVRNSVLVRRSSDGMHHVRAYSSDVTIKNDSASVRHYSIEWGHLYDSSSVEQVLMNGAPCYRYEICDGVLRVSVEIAPYSSKTFSLRRRNHLAVARTLGISWNAQAYFRRRLSELRDNYLSKSPHLLAAAQVLKHCIIRG
ncbi:MAG: hypothetical protein H8K05_00190 [Nitrospira sp.]|nr:hypothetical protein [Nitrospira sp.]